VHRKGSSEQQEREETGRVRQRRAALAGDWRSVRHTVRGNYPGTAIPGHPRRRAAAPGVIEFPAMTPFDLAAARRAAR